MRKRNRTLQGKTCFSLLFILKVSSTNPRGRRSEDRGQHLCYWNYCISVQANLIHAYLYAQFDPRCLQSCFLFFRRVWLPILGSTFPSGDGRIGNFMSSKFKWFIIGKEFLIQALKSCLIIDKYKIQICNQEETALKVKYAFLEDYANLKRMWWFMAFF